MIDMWGMNSVTFVFSHCFVIVGFECLFIILTMLVSSETEVTSDSPSLLVALSLIIFAVATHTMLYNMNVFIKIELLRDRQLRVNRELR
jgi:hypothetical protein